jgi:hypothetical protein
VRLCFVFVQSVSLFVVWTLAPGDDLAAVDGLRVKSGAKKVYNPHFLTMP